MSDALSEGFYNASYLHLNAVYKALINFDKIIEYINFVAVNAVKSL